MENKDKNLQLLESIEKSEKRREAYARVQLIFSGAIAVMLIVFTIVLAGLIPEARGLLERTDTLMTNLESLSSDLAQLDIEDTVDKMDTLLGNVNSLVDNADALVSESQNGVSEALKAIDEIDFDALNSAIKDFSEVVEPLARFFSAFNR